MGQILSSTPPLRISLYIVCCRSTTDMVDGDSAAIESCCDQNTCCSCFKTTTQNDV
jgi:hypothetical protein